jgi:hypothetical protein
MKYFEILSVGVISNWYKKILTITKLMNTMFVAKEHQSVHFEKAFNTCSI